MPEDTSPETTPNAALEGAASGEGHAAPVTSDATPRRPGKGTRGRPKNLNATATAPKEGVAKRGPGRPRKSETEATASTTPRRRGRPRKAEAVAAAPKRGPGRPRKEEAVAPRRRGRPRKTEAAVVAPKRGPGRPRKTEAVVAPPKRGPGRPRKTEAAVAPVPPRRGPGRPRKTEAAVAPPKRGPGRPRKTEAPTPAAAAPRRGPGRPRKTETLARPTAPRGRRPAVVASGGELAGHLRDFGSQAVGLVRAILSSSREEPVSLDRNDVLTPADVSRLVRAPEAGVVEAMRRGELKATRIGTEYRTTRAHVAAWLG